MSEVPSPVSESTAIEVLRKEGSTFSAKAVNTITAGDILWFANSSGVTQTVTFSGTTDTIVGVALFQATSGQRVTSIRGKVRVIWDGATTGPVGSPIAPSSVRSGWFEVSSGTAAPIGAYVGLPGAVSLAAGVSGTLQVVEIY